MNPKFYNYLQILIIAVVLIVVFQLAFKLGFILIVLGIGFWVGYKFQKNKLNNK